MAAYVGITVKLSVIPILVLLSAEKSLSQRLSDYPDVEQRVCDSMDIRNQVEELMYLRGCSIIVGFLSITLIDNKTANAYEEYSFPELREITDYFLLYRVTGLKTLSILFPNLSIIRGNSLFFNYAMIVYELPHLEEATQTATAPQLPGCKEANDHRWTGMTTKATPVLPHALGTAPRLIIAACELSRILGLKSLTSVQRGAIRIEKNDQLCFLNTIDWNLITGREDEHYIKGNGDRIKCHGQICRDTCHREKCWKKDICQRLITRNNSTRSCHAQCDRGCVPYTNECYDCRYFTDDGVCVSGCPKNKYVIAGSNYCIGKNECKKLFFGHGWIWNGTCRKYCPKGYNLEQTAKGKACIKCANSKCAKECSGIEVTSIDHAQRLRGCSIVNGSLQIKLIGYQSKYIMKELEENLGDIEEIKGFLKIYRSFRITSLAFLKNLKTIGGNHLENGKSSLLVYEMQNLQYLWHWNVTKPLHINRGSIFFHNNPKLCLSEIGNLLNVLRINVTIFEVSQESNGYKIGCRYDNIETSSSVLGKHNATIQWERYKAKTRGFLGYNVYYVESLDDEVTTQYGQDSCYALSWTKQFVPDPHSDVPLKLSINLNGLKSSTKYAYYVETVSMRNEDDISGDAMGQNAQSIVKYFTTKSDKPPPPSIIQAISTHDDSITLYWINDLKYDNLITRYMLKAHILEDDDDELDKRNYCLDPLRLESSDDLIYEPSFGRFFVETSDEPVCDCRIGKIQSNGQTRLNYFNNKDFSTFICQKLDALAFNITNEFKDCTNSLSDSIDDGKGSSDFDELQVVNMYYIYSNITKAPTNNFTFKGLRPYGKYILKLRACIGSDIIDCGPEASTVHRTQKNIESDDIIEVVVNVFMNDVGLYWYPPDFPNGAVLAYNIQYNRIDIKNHMPQTECWTRKDHEDNGYKYSLNLLDGSYRVRLRVISLAGYGNYTDHYYFVVPQYGGNNKTILGFVCFFVMAISIVISFYSFNKRCSRKSDDQDILIDNIYTRARFINNDEDESVSFMRESVLDYDRDLTPKPGESKLVWGYDNHGADL